MPMSILHSLAEGHVRWLEKNEDSRRKTLRRKEEEVGGSLNKRQMAFNLGTNYGEGNLP